MLEYCFGFIEVDRNTYGMEGCTRSNYERGAEISVSDSHKVHLWHPLALAMEEQAVLEVLMDSRVHLVQSTGWEERLLEMRLRDRVDHDDDRDSEPDIIDGVGKTLFVDASS